MNLTVCGVKIFSPFICRYHLHIIFMMSKWIICIVIAQWNKLNLRSSLSLNNLWNDFTQVTLIFSVFFLIEHEPHVVQNSNLCPHFAPNHTFIIIYRYLMKLYRISDCNHSICNRRHTSNFFFIVVSFTDFMQNIQIWETNKIHFKWQPKPIIYIIKLNTWPLVQSNRTRKQVIGKWRKIEITYENRCMIVIVQTLRVPQKKKISVRLYTNTIKGMHTNSVVGMQSGSTKDFKRTIISNVFKQQRCVYLQNAKWVVRKGQSKTEYRSICCCNQQAEKKTVANRIVLSWEIPHKI